ncbi:MAG: very short patch repair endonuclease [Planctomycetes bacterium]|nr:very short patch repair endonuclease [Planctomycetota bacterium]
MRRVRREDTAPEVALRRALHRAGVRFRLHAAGLPGRPDIVLVKARVAVFVDGCFWHGCPEHFVQPKTNSTFWLEKVQTNQERDRRVDGVLRAAGWSVVRVWEHEDPELVAVPLTRLWFGTVDQRSGRRHSR